MTDEKSLESLLDKLEKLVFYYKNDNEETVLKALITRILNEKYDADGYLNRIPILERAVLVLLKKALKEKEDKKEDKKEDEKEDKMERKVIW